jgi:flagellar basal-body rod protein FlgC
MNRELGVNLIEVNRVSNDRSDFGKRLDPSHPAADKDGYVLTPNVNKLVEMMDMREAQRSYEANLSAIRTSRRMLNKTLELLR